MVLVPIQGIPPPSRPVERVEAEDASIRDEGRDVVGIFNKILIFTEDGVILGRDRDHPGLTLLVRHVGDEMGMWRWRGREGRHLW